MPKPATSSVVAFLLGGCWHSKMGWPIRLDSCTYRVCLGCGIKRLFDEKSFLSYGRYSYDVKQLKRPGGTIHAFRPGQEMAVSQMITKLMKWIAIAALFLALFWQPFAENRILLQYVVWAGAIVVFAQAVRARKYIWIGLFLAVAGLFNPIRPVALAANIFLVLDAITMVLFMVSLGRGLEMKPRLSIASITDRTPGSESL